MATMYANAYIRLSAFRSFANMEYWASDFTLSFIHSFTHLLTHYNTRNTPYFQPSR